MYSITTLILVSLLISSIFCVDVQWGDESIVRSNQVQYSWKPGTSNVVVDPYTSNTLFWLMGDPSEEIGEIELYVTSGQDVCIPNLQIEPTLGDEYYSYMDDYYYFSEEDLLEVVYECKKPGVVGLHLVIPVKTLEGVNNKIELAWSKNCASGKRSGLNLGSDEGLNNVIYDGEALEVWTSGDKIIPSSSSLTTFYLEVDQGSQAYSLDLSSSSSKVVEVHSRGSGGVPNIVTEDEYFHDITVLYNCIKEGSSLITLTLNVPPFTPITLKWTKLCGGTHEGGINVGLSKNTVGVMKDSEVVESFSKYSAKATDRHTDFYLSIDEGMQRYEGIIVTSQPGGILRPYIEINGKKPESGFLTSEPQKFTVGYECYKKGDAEVTVTLLLPPYKMIEFSYEKRCVKLTPLSEENVWTTNQLIILFVVFSVGLAMVVMGLKKYSKDVKKR